MRALVTGGSGFVGAHVVRALLDRNVETAVFLRHDGPPWRLAEVSSRLHVVRGDLAAPGASAPAIAAFRPDTVLHLGWEGVANTARNDPRQLGTNVTGTLALLDVVAAAGARTFVGLGSQAEYGRLEGRIDETHPTRPTTLYGVAKLAAGLASGIRATELGLRHVWLRLFSVYGPLDDGPWLIPYVTRALLAGDTPALTAGTQRWDYLFVADVAEAVLAAAADERAHGVYNLGSGEARPVRTIVEAVRDVVDPSARLAFGTVPMRPDQVMHLEADTSRLAADTGWFPRTEFADGIRRTVEWLRAHGPRDVD